MRIILLLSCLENKVSGATSVHANLQVGQTASGKFLSVLTGEWGGYLTYAQQIQLLMAIVVSCGLAIISLHVLITRLFPTVHSEEGDQQRLAEQLERTGPGKAKQLLGKPESQAEDGQTESSASQKKKLTLKQVIAFLTRSPQIRCLAVMALSQGLSTNLIDIAWKSHLHKLHPSPAAYSVCCFCIPCKLYRVLLVKHPQLS